MTEMEFTSRPSVDEITDKTCRYQGCDDRITHIVSFLNPKEYIPYCQECAFSVHGEYGSRSVKRL